jgi:acetyl esterase
MTTYADAYPLTRATMDWFMGHYMGPDADPADPRLSPDKTAGCVRFAPRR